MRARWLIPLLLTCGCNSAVGPGDQSSIVITPQLGLPFDLRVGWWALFTHEGVELKFIGLVEDSRCPGGPVRCIWQGNGAIAVAISGPAAAARVDTLHTTLDPKSVAIGNLRLEFTRLLPDPEADRSIPPEQYVATFVLRGRR